MGACRFMTTFLEFENHCKPAKALGTKKDPISGNISLIGTKNKCPVSGNNSHTEWLVNLW